MESSGDCEFMGHFKFSSPGAKKRRSVGGRVEGMSLLLVDRYHLLLVDRYHLAIRSRWWVWDTLRSCSKVSSRFPRSGLQSLG